jgi:hypothetical protein
VNGLEMLVFETFDRGKLSTGTIRGIARKREGRKEKQ